MADSILVTVKKLLGFDAAYTEFDLDIITHINSALFTLNQLGVGPSDAFMIEDDTATWDQFTGPDKIASVKSYIFLKVRMAFDPPTTSFTQAAFQKQIDEYEWRLNVHSEGVTWLATQTPII